jgi:hypothetical protein
MRRCYLEGYGPDIISDESYAVIFNGQIISYSPQSVSHGRYLVRSLNYSDSVFEVISATFLNDPLPSNGTGWELKCWKNNSNYDLEGGLICEYQAYENPLKEWLRLHNGQRVNNIKAFKNILLRTINNANAKKP